ncbi:dirigent protein 21-like [Salvia miltiorrhiza]|uniref:dirigent protein 21-like n=1 Tax=Salvia miltiorrhiza TaxID=226208 RepID=UPI0025ACE0AF|nr:dirigent protein 21-like [Salvia miltiorrhiza]
MANLALILTISCFFASTLSVDARRIRSIAEDETKFLGSACSEKEKLIKLHFFVQDLGVNHPHTTTYDVAEASITANSATGFGKVRVIDDLVTAEADANSRPLGRAQGLVTKSDLNTIGITMNINIYFTSGQFAGSTLSILGRNEINDDQRELVVAGGTGVFRFAHGYALQSTAAFGQDLSVLEYYVFTTSGPKFVDLDDVEVVAM